MKNKLKKLILLLALMSTLSLAAMGCSSAPVSNQDSEPAPAADEIPADEPENLLDNNAEEDIKTPEETTEASDNKSQQSVDESNSGKWHILDPEMAEYLDADFECIVWKLDEGSFYAAEVYCEILEDGSLLSSNPSSESTLDDSDLFQVIYDDDTYFYIRTIYDNGERYEDTDAAPDDLEEYMNCDLKGSFQDDIFYATEIRMIKIQ